VLVDENGGNGDSLAMPKSLNHTKTSENTGRLRPRDLETRARSKRSLERQRQNHRPLDLLDGGDGDVGANGDGTVVEHDNPVKDSLSSRTLYARTNRALPRQMYDATMEVKSLSSKRLPPTRKHRKRQASDMIVYRKDSDDDDDGNIMAGSVDIVPLDSEHRIRVNLTIASDDDSAGSPMYALSLSLPRADQVEPVRVPAAVVNPPNSVPPLLQSPGAECDCFCPCLGQDDDDDDDDDDGDRTVTANIVPTISSTFSPIGNTTTDTIWSTEYSTTESPEPTLDVVSCPPPVLLFCDTGKSLMYTLERDENEGDNHQQLYKLARRSNFISFELFKFRHLFLTPIFFS